MSDTIHHNNVLNQWIRRLDNTRLPVYKAQRQLALHALQNPKKTLGDIAQEISQAPTIAFIIMREANRNSSALAEPVQNLESALSRLGMQRCGALLDSLVNDQETNIPLALRQVWLIGQHLNVQALGLFGNRMARLRQEIHVGSLLFLAPIWPLVTRHPEFFYEWEQRVLGDHEPAEKVERELLGVSLTALCLGLAEYWQLPHWIIEGYRLLSENSLLLANALHIARQTDQPLLQQKMLDEQPTLNTWLNRPANTVVFACGLVLAAHNAWGNEQCIRWQRLISLYLKRDLAEIQQLTHQLAVEHARRQQHHHELWQPAQALLWPWSTQRLKQPRATLDSTTTPAESAAPDSSSTSATTDNYEPNQLRSHCIALAKSPSPFTSLDALIQRISLALQACGLQRLAIILLNSKTQQGQVVHSHGIAHEQLTAKFALPNNSVTAHLLKQPTQLVLTAKNSERITPLLPVELTRVFAEHSWVLSSVSNSHRVVMLICADQAPEQLQTTTLQNFKKTLEYIERALLLYGSRHR